MKFKKVSRRRLDWSAPTIGKTSATADESSVITRASVTERVPVIECESPGEFKSTRIGLEMAGLSVPV